MINIQLKFHTSADDWLKEMGVIRCGSSLGYCLIVATPKLEDKGSSKDEKSMIPEIVL